MNQIFRYSWKEHVKLSKIAKSSGKMLWITENIARQSLRILYTVLRAEKPTIFGQNIVAFSVHNANIYTNTQSYVFRHLQHFATKLCNFIDFKMPFSAVVKHFVHIAWIKI